MLTLLEIILFIVLFVMFLVFTKKKWFIKIFFLLFFLFSIVITFSISLSPEDSFNMKSIFRNYDYTICEVVHIDQQDMVIYESPNHYFEVDVYDSFLGIYYYESKQFDIDYFQSADNDVLYVFSRKISDDETLLLIYLPSDLTISTIQVNETSYDNGDSRYFFITTSEDLNSSTTFTLNDKIYYLP